MAWELYKRERSVADHPAITISRLGRMTFNRVAVDELREAKASTLDLLWDSDANRFAVRVADKQLGAFAVAHPKDNPNAMAVSCIAFLNKIHYDWTETRVFQALWDSKAKMFIVDVPQEHTGTKEPIKRSAQRGKSGAPSRKPA